MVYSLIEIEQRGGIGILRLNSPKTLNALRPPMSEEILRALDELSTRCRVIVLTGAGRAFCAGADLAAAQGPTDQPFDYGASLEQDGIPIMLRLRELPVPIISAVRGAAAGFGCAMALAADLIVASETAYFLQSFSRIGLVPDGGSSHLLARVIGRPRAMEMMLLGERLSAAKALEWGLVNRVVPDDELETATLELAARLADGPSSLSQIRRIVWSAVDEDFEDIMRLELKEQRAASLSADCAEGIAAFIEKRPARFGKC